MAGGRVEGAHHEGVQRIEVWPTVLCVRERAALVNSTGGLKKELAVAPPVPPILDLTQPNRSSQREREKGSPPKKERRMTRA